MRVRVTMVVAAIIASTVWAAPDREAQTIRAAGIEHPRKPGPCAGPWHGKSDFNGDGYQDFVLGDPRATVNERRRAGRLRIVYGSKRDPGHGSVDTLRQGLQGVGDKPQRGDRFGKVLEVGNLNGDSCADLMIGVPNERLGGHQNAGVVHLLFGSGKGLGRGRPGLVLKQGALGLPDVPEGGDRFGSAVSAGDLAGRPPEIAISAPGEDLRRRNVGTVTFVALDQKGHPRNSSLWHQDSAGVPDRGEPRDGFGTAVALRWIEGCGDEERSCRELIVGTPREDLANARDAGAVTIISDVAEGGKFTQFWTQNSPGVDDTAEAGDRFGATVDGGFDGYTGLRRLAVGSPGEDVGRHRNAGGAHLFQFRTLRVSGGGSQFITQARRGVLGKPDENDRFGSVLRVYNWNVTGNRTWLVIGVPNDDVRNARDAGSVHIFFDDPTAYNRRLTQAGRRIPGKPEPGDRFGAELASLPYPVADLLVGAPGEGKKGSVTVVPWIPPGGDPDWPQSQGRLLLPGDGQIPKRWASPFGSKMATRDSP